MTNDDYVMPDPIGDNNVDQRLVRKDQMDDAIDTFDPVSQSFTDMSTPMVIFLGVSLAIILGAVIFG